MSIPHGSNPLRLGAVSLVASAAAMLTTVAGTDVVEGLVASSTRAELAPAAAARSQVAAEPLVAFGQQVERRVVLRPLSGAGVDSRGRSLVGISRTGSHDVPTVALRAYKNAAATLRRVQPSCDISWTLLAGIGRVESDHGRYGGSVLGSDGLPRPAIRGVALNGVGPVAAIPDSDNGRFDGDKVWDRAVGPMQFIPTTWAFSGRDGDGDGKADPNDIDDAALAAARYLCPGTGTTSGLEDWRAQVFRYNHSDYYVDLVMAFERGYRTGTFAIPSPPPPPAPAEPTGTDKRDPGKRDKPKGGSQPPPAQPAPKQPKTSPAPAPQGPKGSGGGSQGGSKDKPKGPGGSGGSGGGSGGGSKPPPTPSPTPTPTPPPAPEYTESSGTLSTCSGGWCVGGTKLNFGSGSAQAKSDFDGDGTVESNSSELAGLESSTVEVTVKTSSGLVVELQGKAY